MIRIVLVLRPRSRPRFYVGMPRTKDEHENEEEIKRRPNSNT